MAALLEAGLLAAVTLGLWLFLRPSITLKEKKEIGVSRASMIYSDEKGAKMLVAESCLLQGRPDMIFETWLLKKYIPLEIKSGRLKEDFPHQGDLFQLAAYFIIIEEVYGKRPPYGKLVYANKTFKVRNTRKLRKAVLRTVTEMREMLEGSYEPCAAPDFVKCKNCICRDTVCEWTEGE